MLLALRPEFVAHHWPEVREYVSAAIPPVGLNEGHSLNKVLEQILLGKIVCWAILDNERILRGFLLTTIVEDYCTGTRSCLVYSVAGEIFKSQEIWKDGFEALVTYAKGMNCRLLSAYTRHDKLAEVVRHFGFNIDWKYIYLEV